MSLFIVFVFLSAWFSVPSVTSTAMKVINLFKSI